MCFFSPSPLPRQLAAIIKTDKTALKSNSSIILKTNFGPIFFKECSLTFRIHFTIVCT